MNTLATPAGPRLPYGPVIPRDHAALMPFAIAADRLADALLAAGRLEQAERLAHAAFEARCRAMGGRA